MRKWEQRYGVLLPSGRPGDSGATASGRRARRVAEGAPREGYRIGEAAALLGDAGRVRSRRELRDELVDAPPRRDARSRASDQAFSLALARVVLRGLLQPVLDESASAGQQGGHRRAGAPRPAPSALRSSDCSRTRAADVRGTAVARVRARRAARDRAADARRPPACRRLAGRLPRRRHAACRRGRAGSGDRCVRALLQRGRRVRRRAAHSRRRLPQVPVTTTVVLGGRGTDERRRRCRRPLASAGWRREPRPVGARGQRPPPSRGRRSSRSTAGDFATTTRTSRSSGSRHARRRGRSPGSRCTRPTAPCSGSPSRGPRAAA